MAHTPEALTGCWNTELNLQNGGLKGDGHCYNDILKMLKYICETDLGQPLYVKFLLMSDYCCTPFFFSYSISSQSSFDGANDTSELANDIKS